MQKQKITVEFDGRIYEVEIIEKDAETLEITVNGKAHRVKLKQPPKQSGQPTKGIKPSLPETLEAAPALPSSEQKHATPSGDVTAPMPGDIVDISVNVGDAVERGQQLLVLEAMKMKNVIRSPKSGIVSAVEVSVGQSVKFGHTMIRFE